MDCSTIGLLPTKPKLPPPKKFTQIHSVRNRTKMPNSQCTTLSDAAACADTLGGCPDAEGRVIGFAIRVAIRAIESNHECTFVEMLASLSNHYDLCEGSQYHQAKQEGH